MPRTECTCTWGSFRRHSSRATLLSLFHSASAARQRRRPSVASMCAGARGLLAVAAYLRSYASSASSHRFSFSYHDSYASAGRVLARVAREHTHVIFSQYVAGTNRRHINSEHGTVMADTGTRAYIKFAVGVKPI